MEKNRNTTFTTGTTNEVNIGNEVLFIAAVMSLSRINGTLPWAVFSVFVQFLCPSSMKA